MSKSCEINSTNAKLKLSIEMNVDDEWTGSVKLWWAAASKNRLVTTVEFEACNKIRKFEFYVLTIISINLIMTE